VPYKMNPYLFCIVDHESLIFSKDLVHGFDSSTDFHRIRPVFKNLLCEKKIQNNLICIDLEGFVYKSCKLSKLHLY
jgi:hypothetical protein